MKIVTKKDRRHRIQLRSRKRLAGTKDRPRLAVFRSLSHVYVQVIDDLAGRTIASASSRDPRLKETFGSESKTRGGNVSGAKAVGKAIAEQLIEKGIKRVVFDRGGYLYHGRIRAVADAAREAGLEF
jgi:large subunit ribosomal protein L18